MKIFVKKPNENWIVDRMVDEFYSYYPDLRTDSIYDADIVWLLADWCYDQLPYDVLQYKKVVTTIHHVVIEKWIRDSAQRRAFAHRDKITDYYHVFNARTEAFVAGVSPNKEIFEIPYWVNTKLWKKQGKIKSRKYLNENFNLGIPLGNNVEVIGSFQRDTEGSDLISPKLEKGPDIFCDYVESRWKSGSKIFVLLGGWRRQYVMKRLKAANVPFVYLEKPADEVMKYMYSSLDLYVVGSRCEGGPQSLLESGAIGVQCISTPVGIAEQVLPPESISTDLLLATPNIPDVSKHLDHVAFPRYYDFFTEIASRLFEWVNI